MPSRSSQEELLFNLHRDVELDPDETSFVEVRIKIPRYLYR